MQTRRLFVFVVLLAIIAFGWAAPLQAEDVGKFTRVVNQVDQLKKGKDPAVPAKVTAGVENQDVVSTKEQALAVVQFVDDSTMTISPKSKVTIEDYMYDASKARTKGTIKVLEGVVETVIPTTDKLQQKDIQIRTTTAIAGIRGTKVVTVARPEGSVFYVVSDPHQAKPGKGKIRIRLYSKECQPDPRATKFVAERHQKKMPLRQIVEEALEARLDPCPVIKAAILLGIDVGQLVAAFQQVCSGDPEYKDICNPCLILRCTIEALRCLKEVDVAEGQYGILMQDKTPILGTIKLEEMNRVLGLPTTGGEVALPGYPPSPEQLYQACLPQETQEIFKKLIQLGVPESELQACLNTICPPPEIYGYSSGGPPVVIDGGGGPQSGSQ